MFWNCRTRESPQQETPTDLSTWRQLLDFGWWTHQLSKKQGQGCLHLQCLKPQTCRPCLVWHQPLSWVRAKPKLKMRIEKWDDCKINAICFIWNAEMNLRSASYPLGKQLGILSTSKTFIPTEFRWFRHVFIRCVQHAVILGLGLGFVTSIIVTPGNQIQQQCSILLNMRKKWRDRMNSKNLELDSFDHSSWRNNRHTMWVNTAISGLQISKKYNEYQMTWTIRIHDFILEKIFYIIHKNWALSIS